MRMGQGVRTGLGQGGITCVLQTQFSGFLFFFFLPFFIKGGGGGEGATNSRHPVGCPGEQSSSKIRSALIGKKVPSRARSFL